VAQVGPRHVAPKCCATARSTKSSRPGTSLGKGAGALALDGWVFLRTVVHVNMAVRVGHDPDKDFNAFPLTVFGTRHSEAVKKALVGGVNLTTHGRLSRFCVLVFSAFTTPYRLGM
jgi:hypothetical protein